MLRRARAPPPPTPMSACARVGTRLPPTLSRGGRKTGTRGCACCASGRLRRGRDRALTPLIPSPFGSSPFDPRSRRVLTPLIPSPFGRGETRARPSFPLSAFAERGTGGEDYERGTAGEDHERGTEDEDGHARTQVLRTCGKADPSRLRRSG